MHYERSVHNQLQTRGREAYSSVRVRHYGYDLSKEKMEAKHIRTTRLLKEALSKDPEDAYSIFQLAASHSMHREFDKAVEYGEMALEIMRRRKLRNSFFLTAFYTVAQGYYALGKVEEAERIGLEALELYPMHLDMCHLLATIYFRRHSFNLCRDISRRYLSIHEAYEKTPSLMNFYCHSFAKRNEIYLGLACIHFATKDYASADDFFQKAFQDSPNSLEMAESICRLYLKQGMNQEGLAWLRKGYEAGLQEGRTPLTLLDRNNLYLKIGQMYLHQGKLELATDCIKKSRDEFLTTNEQLEKRLSLATLSWISGEIDALAKDLGTLMNILGMDPNRHINTIVDLAYVVYELAEVFGLRQEWHLAEGALNLAVKMAPAIFDYARFNRLLPSSRQQNHPAL